MDRLVIRLFCSALFCTPFLICGQTVSSDGVSLQSRLAAIQSRSAEHEARVRSLLAQPDLVGTNFDLPITPNAVEVDELPEVDVEPSFMPVPEYYDADEIEEVKEVPSPPSADDLVADPNLETSSENEKPSEDLDEAYSRPIRIEGAGASLRLLFRCFTRFCNAR